MNIKETPIVEEISDEQAGQIVGGLLNIRGLGNVGFFVDGELRAQTGDGSIYTVISDEDGFNLGVKLQ